MTAFTERTDHVALRWTLWTLCVTVWTVALLTPEPVRISREVLPHQLTFPAAKTLHVAAYAFLAILSGWLHVRGDKRWLLIAFLSLHGAATEFFQTFVEERSGSWRDVGLDHVGIMVGLALSWKWWRPRAQVVRREPMPAERAA